VREREKEREREKVGERRRGRGRDKSVRVFHMWKRNKNFVRKNTKTSEREKWYFFVFFFNPNKMFEIWISIIDI
jgi:hypothetical protein